MQLAMAAEQSTASPVVTLSDVSHLLPISRELAEMYCLSGAEIAELCSRNASAAAAVNRPDLVRAWSVAGLVADSRLPVHFNPDSGIPWSQHPFSRLLISSLFEHYQATKDVQTLAMLSCVFQIHCHNVAATLPPPSHSNNIYVRSYSPSGHHNHRNSSTGPILSSSWHEIGSNFQNGGGGLAAEDDEGVQEERSHQQNCLLLDSLLMRQGDEYRRCYANILYRWQLLEKRAEVVKLQSIPTDDHTMIGFKNYCRDCGKQVNEPVCRTSKCFAFNCNICNLSVRGSSNFCLSCGHGGHTAHMQWWFATHTVCPAGCGCCCLEASGWT